MEKITRFTPEERENLTAYLDGELDEKAVTEIETKLGRSEVARREVEILEHTWDMLNYLPRPNASAEFSQKTMSMARMDSKPASWDAYDNGVRWLQRVGSMTVWALALTVVAVIGFQLTNRWVPDSSRQLVEEMPLIQNLDNYKEVGDLEFIRQLESHNPFQESPAKVEAPDGRK